jgi:hypothetical protein
MIRNHERSIRTVEKHGGKKRERSRKFPHVSFLAPWGVEGIKDEITR